MPDIQLEKLCIKQPKAGDIRRTTRTFKKGTVLGFDKDPEKYKLTCDITMDVEEVYTVGHYGDSWVLKSYYTSTSQPAPSWWGRFVRWLHVPATALPTATVVRE